MFVLLALLLIPVAGAVLVTLAGRVNPLSARVVALATMLLDLAFGIAVFAGARTGPLVVHMEWIRSFGVSFWAEADGLSAVLVLLTTLLGVLAVVISWKEIHSSVSMFHVWLLLLQLGILMVFVARDLMLFYFGWELMLIPMFALIGGWGHEEKLYSAYKFFLFTFTGSVFMLVALLYVYFQHAAHTGVYSFALSDLVKTPLSAREQWWVYLGLFLGFAVKIPLFPLHTWLPDAHTQAPTAGSLILAGLLLKTGVYGLWRIANALAPHGATVFGPYIIVLAVVGIFYGAIVAFAQHDFKRLVAYSSISHLGFVVLGLFIGTTTGLQGATLQMVNHGLATGALFLIAGMLQERTHTRSFKAFGGLWRQLPAMGGFLLFFSFASLGIPGTGNFVGELYVIGSAFGRNMWLGSVTCFGILFAAIYSLRVFVATMQGPESGMLKKLSDVNPREAVALGVLVAALVGIGFYPHVVTAPLSYPPNRLLPAPSQSASTRQTSQTGRTGPTSPPQPATCQEVNG